MYDITLCSMISFGIIMYFAMFDYIIQYNIELYKFYSTISYYILLNHIVPYYVQLYYVRLYYMIYYHIALVFPSYYAFVVFYIIVFLYL